MILTKSDMIISKHFTLSWLRKKFPTAKVFVSALWLNLKSYLALLVNNRDNACRLLRMRNTFIYVCLIYETAYHPETLKSNRDELSNSEVYSLKYIQECKWPPFESKQYETFANKEVFQRGFSTPVECKELPAITRKQ